MRWPSETAVFQRGLAWPTILHWTVSLNPKIKSGRFDDLIEEKGPLARQLECGSNATRNDAKAPKMRLKVRRLWRAIKQELPIQFGHEQLTSYGGLELVRRYFQLIELKARIRRALGEHYTRRLRR